MSLETQQAVNPLLGIKQLGAVWQCQALCASSTVWLSPGIHTGRVGGVPACSTVALSLAVSALGRGLCSGKREERQSPEPVTATGLVAP